MEPAWIVAALAVALVVVVGVALRQRRQLRLAESSLARHRHEIAQRDAEVAEARTALDDLLDALEVGVLRLDRDGRITVANGGAHAILGRPSGGLVGRSALEAFLDPRVEGLVRDARVTGTAVVELSATEPQGRTRIVDARRTTTGELWLIVHDVSDLRRLQRIRAEFIDNVSHELRTPLTTVSLLAESLAREADAAAGQVPQKMRDRIAKIEVETGHLVQMVTELLDLSRIERGGTLEFIEDVDLGRLVPASVDRLRLFAERQGVRLDVTTDPELPVVRGDEARLGQVMVNLVHNAVKFSPPGGAIEIRVRRDDDEVVTSVRDHGVGIPPAARDRVFERFYKVDRARLRAGAGGGTGLGLAIARHIVEQHGGRIWLESAEGDGSTFSFAIPVSRPS